MDNSDSIVRTQVRNYSLGFSGEIKRGKLGAGREAVIESAFQAPMWLIMHSLEEWPRLARNLTKTEGAITDHKKRGLPYIQGKLPWLNPTVLKRTQTESV